MYPPPVDYGRNEYDEGEEVEADDEEEEWDQARRGCVPPYFTGSESWYFLI